MKLDRAGLSCDAFGDVRVLSARGVEAMNELGHWEVTFLSERDDLDTDDALGAPATLELRSSRSARGAAYVVSSIVYDGESRDGHRYTATLDDPMWFLSLSHGYRIHQHKTAHQIVAGILDGAGIAHEARLAGRYVERAQCSQYGEDVWSFCQRILAEDGINYAWDALDGAPTLVFSDSHSAYEGLVGDPVLRFAPPSHAAHDAETFHSLTAAVELAPTAVHLRDFDIRQPAVFIEGKAGDGPLEHFAYPARMPHAEAAAAQAKRRLDQLRRDSNTLRGQTDSPRLQPGRVVRIQESGDETIDGDWLVIRVEHELSDAAAHGQESSHYVARATMVPHDRSGKTAFRPAFPEARPAIRGIESARVTGPAGEDIHVDDLGRVKLALPWDPDGVKDDTSSTWARSLQWGVGASMMLPRVNFSVGVAYDDGHPDFPIVLGKLYDGENTPPYALPEHKATTALQSATSHGGDANEIRMGDNAGSQLFSVHASNTQNVFVGGSRTTTVGAKEQHDITLGYGVDLGSQTVTVGGSQSVDVNGPVQIVAKGSRSESVGGIESIGVKANRMIECGAYTEAVGAVYALQCNVTATTVQGAYSEATGANLVIAAGLGMHESVAAARLENVAGSRNIVAGMSCEDWVMGAKTTTVGGATETSGGGYVIDAPSISVRASSADWKAGGGIFLSGSKVNVTLGSLSVDAGASLSASGSISASGGTTSIKASSTTHKSNAKAGS